MTETSVCVTAPSEHDVIPRAAGSLLPATLVKLIDQDGQDIQDYDKPGEILVQAPSVVLGYLKNEKANASTFVHDESGRWIRTGDIGLMTIAPSGNEQLIIVDRIKELIKVMVRFHARIDSFKTQVTDVRGRVIKLLPRSSRLICWHIRLSQTVLSFKYPTRRPAKCPKPSLFASPPLNPSRTRISQRH